MPDIYWFNSDTYAEVDGTLTTFYHKDRQQSIGHDCAVYSVMPEADYTDYMCARTSCGDFLLPCAKATEAFVVWVMWIYSNYDGCE